MITRKQYENHDCHQSPEDGCKTCIEYIDQDKDSDLEYCPKCGSVLKSIAHIDHNTLDEVEYIGVECEECGYYKEYK